MTAFIKIPVLLLLLFTACNNAGTPETAVKAKQDTITVTDTRLQLQVKDDKINALYQQYTLLTAALVNGDTRASRLAANAIMAVADKLEDNKNIRANAGKLIATADIEVQRTAFSALSNGLLELIRHSGLQHGQLYVDFCPMALQDKGAIWLSAEKAIQNPYFGAGMLTCGSIQETIQ